MGVCPTFGTTALDPLSVCIQEKLPVFKDAQPHQPGEVTHGKPTLHPPDGNDEKIAMLSSFHHQTHIHWRKGCKRHEAPVPMELPVQRRKADAHIHK